VLLDSEPSPPRHPRPAGHWNIAPHTAEHTTLKRLYPESLIRGAKAGADALRHPGETLSRGVAIGDLVVHEELIAAPECSLNRPLGATRAYRAVRFGLDDLKAIEHALGGTVNDVVLAISAGALRRLLLERGETPPAAGLRAQIPVDIRTAEHARATGNVLTSLFVELPVGEEDALTRYGRIVERAESLKKSSQPIGGKALVDLAALAPPLLGQLLGRAMFGGDRVFNLTITNVRASETPLYAFGARLREVLPYVPLFAGHSVGIAVVSFAGGLVFGLGADRTSTPDIDTIAEGVDASFAELCRAAGVRGSRSTARRRAQRG
jgi:WS/DGAT/MGAT family acyltransferase